jgi:hypothetical protein
MPLDEETKTNIDERAILQLGQEAEVPQIREAIGIFLPELNFAEIEEYLSEEKIQELNQRRTDRALSQGVAVERTIQGTPSKRIINTRAKQMTLPYALAEFIDNSIESWESINDDMPLKISINFDLDTASITIEDNAAGMSPDTLGIAISPGNSIWNRSTFSTGRFGEGLKIGIANIGTCCELITTNHIGEMLTRSSIDWGGEQVPCPTDNPSECNHDGCYYDDNNKNWNKKISYSSTPYLNAHLNPTGTTIKITHLNPNILELIQSPEKYAELLTELLRLYSTKIRESGGNISIVLENKFFNDGFVNSVSLERFTDYNEDYKSYNQSDLADAFYKLPGVLHPIKSKLILTYSEGQPPLEVEVLTGIRKGDWNGVTIWANNRLMEWRSKNITQPSAGRGYHSYKYDRADRNLLSFVHIKCEDSSKIPWRGPMKKGLYIDTDDEESEGLIISKFISWTMFRYNKYRIELSSQRLDAGEEESLGKNLANLLQVNPEFDCRGAEKIDTPINWEDEDIPSNLDSYFNCHIRNYYPGEFISTDDCETNTSNALALMKNTYRLGQMNQDSAMRIDQVMKLRSNQDQRQRISLGMMFSALEPKAFFELEEEE